MSRRTRIRWRAERAVLGAVFGVVAKIVERRLLRAVRGQATSVAWPMRPDEERGMPMRKLVMVGTAAALIMAACGGEETTPGAEEEQQQEGPASVSVQTEEYEFVGVPGSLPAGEVSFDVENVGDEDHEMNLARIISDRPVEEVIDLEDEELMEHIEPVGGTFVEQGQSGQFTVTLEAGRYGYVCFVQAPDGEPHAHKGMFGEFTVE